MMNATWVSIATLFNVAMVMHYKWEVDLSLSCNIVLAILLVELVIWFAFENFSKLQSALNFSYTDWPVVLWALSASLAKNYDSDVTSSKFTLALVIIAAITFIVRIALQIVKNHTSSYTNV
jgi:membrane protein DedA with SNARE-associated domain